jgi:hypothetical protein
LDQEDLAIISAHVQDAIVRMKDAVWLPKARRFSVTLQRFVPDMGAGSGARVWAALSFEHVDSVAAQRLDPARADAFGVFLSLDFEAGEAPSGLVHLHFADGGAIRLQVDCIDIILTDIGPGRPAIGKPRHDDV